MFCYSHIAWSLSSHYTIDESRFDETNNLNCAPSENSARVSLGPPSLIIHDCSSLITEKDHLNS